MYLKDMRNFHWDTVCSSSNNLNEVTLKTIEAIKTIIDKHAPKKGFYK